MVWVATLFVPSGRYQTEEAFGQLMLSPINGVYGLRNSEMKVIDSETVGRIFGQVGVIVFIMSIGASISVSSLVG